MYPLENWHQKGILTIYRSGELFLFDKRSLQVYSPLDRQVVTSGDWIDQEDLQNSRYWKNVTKGINPDLLDHISSRCYCHQGVNICDICSNLLPMELEESERWNISNPTRRLAKVVLEGATIIRENFPHMLTQIEEFSSPQKIYLAVEFYHKLMQVAAQEGSTNAEKLQQTGRALREAEQVLLAWGRSVDDLRDVFDDWVNSPVNRTTEKRQEILQQLMKWRSPYPSVN